MGVKKWSMLSKKTFLLVGALLTNLTLLAGPIGRNAACQRAKALLGCAELPELVYVAPGDEPAYYVFNHQSGKGFVVVAGDDCVDAVLGFSDEESFDPQNVPPALTDWLSCCEQHVKMARQGHTVAKRAPRRSAEIAPMVTARWGQRNPFNRMCPEYDSGANCAAGCLAIAMAQLLHYWRPSTPTQPIPAYTTEELGLQVEALPATTFNYDIMADEYDYGDWDEGAQEAARLVRYCGQAAEMDYNVFSGAVTSGEYLARYFGFRQDYTDKYHAEHLSGWEDLLYEELEAGRPMLYSGKKMNGSGHVFVVDGYRDGYFHINWGWYGSSNGYFDVTLANSDDPDSAYLWEGYRWVQMAVIGLQPETSTSVEGVRPTMPSAVIYDMSGRHVSNPTHGLYIANGLKVVIK